MSSAARARGCALVLSLLFSQVAAGCGGGGSTSDGGSGGVDAESADGGGLDADRGDAARAADADVDGGFTLPDTGCALGELDCGTGCASVQSDDANCGTCGQSCATDETCMYGVCQPTTCRVGTTRCTGDCADTMVDTLHCGSCDHPCAAGEVCEAGACVLRCRAPNTPCGMDGFSSCVDLDTDPLNCGACGHVCPAGQSCSGGTCACRGSVTDCSGVCVDTQRDPENCGGCGIVCVRGACTSGACTCRAGVDRCGNTCTDLDTDSSNCGSCGHVCARGSSCSAGACVASSCGGSQTLCSGSCVELQSSTTSCGSCGHACPAGVTCIAGTCGPPNDLRADAIAIVPSAAEVTAMGTTQGASFDGPTVPCGCSSARNVWYRFDLVASGIVYLDTFGSTTNTEIHLTGSTGAALPAIPFTGPYTPGACNDDAPCTGSGWDAGASQTATHLEEGTYYVAVGSCNPGPFTLHLQFLPDTIATDVFTNPIPLASGSSVEGSLREGSASSAACGGVSSGEAAHWFTTCGEPTQRVLLSLCRSDGGSWERNDDIFGPFRDPVLYVRSAATGSVVDCNDDAPLPSSSTDCRGITYFLNPVLLVPWHGIGGGQRGSRLYSTLDRGLHAVIVDEKESSGGLDYELVFGAGSALP